jgi:thiol-disulfide isomerase/thioredoxin
MRFESPLMQLRTFKLLLLATILLAVKPFAAAQAPPQPTADQIMTQAKTQATAEHKNILLAFSASWCGPCHMFEHFLADPAIHPIMDKAFVMERLDVGERKGDSKHFDTPGAVQLRTSLAGADPGYPLIAMLDANGEQIVNSMRPEQGKAPSNIGYPSLPVEVDWFMQMLKQAAPSLSKQDMKTIYNWLHAHGEN